MNISDISTILCLFLGEPFKFLSHSFWRECGQWKGRVIASCKRSYTWVLLSQFFFFLYFITIFCFELGIMLTLLLSRTLNIEKNTTCMEWMRIFLEYFNFFLKIFLFISFYSHNRRKKYIYVQAYLISHDTILCMSE